MQLGHFDIVRRRIGADHIRAQPRHRFAQKSAAAADVEETQAFERRATRGRVRSAPAPGREYRPAGSD